MELNETQQEIVQTTAHKSIIVAAAASGKTQTLTARLQYLLDSGVDPESIVAITFTNMASESIYERVGHIPGLFIGTIHGYANYLLSRAGISTRKTLDDEEFDVLFDMVKENPRCLKPVEHLLLDESQDSNELHFNFILDMVRPAHYMFVGDHRQSIYRFNGARPDILLDLMDEPDVTTFHLNQNYRNGYKILNYAKRIIQRNGDDYYDDSIPMKVTSGRTIETPYSAINLCGAIIDNPQFDKWFVLTRTNLQLDAFASSLKKYEIPFDTFKQSQLNKAALNAKMKEDTVKLLTIHSAKGLENYRVIVVGANFYNLEERCISYVAATRARDMLIWTTSPKKKYF